ncbi:MAG: tetratricopeptide repeat protein [Bacteroidota bacterium]
MDQTQQERIEAYLMGRITEQDWQAFEAKMTADPHLLEAVKNHRQFMQAIEETAFREMIQDIHQEGNFDTRRSIPLYTNRRLLGIAAAILLVMGSIWLFVPKQNKPSLDPYRSFEPDPGLPTILGPTQELDFWEGMNAYKLGEFEEANRLWEPLLKNDPRNDTLLYYLGQLAFVQRQNELAARRLEQVYQQESSVFHEKASWYLAVAKLRIRETPDAKILLEKIAAKAGEFQDEAKALLELID